ncbi:hypothetical protein Lal_00041084 [Lupinus albus]|nr:hypothetical protein Lal_00041084 [Lupinus albus]
MGMHSNVEIGDEYLWVEFLHEILFPHFFHPTLNTRESRTTFRAVVYEIQLYGILHSINPEIDRTYHRLVRQNRTLDTNFVSVSEHPVDENTASEHSVSVHSKYSDSVHSVAFPNFDHSVHSENMAQPPTHPGPRRGH